MASNLGPVQVSLSSSAAPSFFLAFSSPSCARNHGSGQLPAPPTSVSSCFSALLPRPRASRLLTPPASSRLGSELRLVTVALSRLLTSLASFRLSPELPLGHGCPIPASWPSPGLTRSPLRNGRASVNHLWHLGRAPDRHLSSLPFPLSLSLFARLSVHQAVTFLLSPSLSLSLSLLGRAVHQAVTFPLSPSFSLSARPSVHEASPFLSPFPSLFLSPRPSIPWSLSAGKSQGKGPTFHAVPLLPLLLPLNPPGVIRLARQIGGESRVLRH